MSALAPFLGIGVGLALGLTGGGGSLFAFPLLLYALQQTPQSAAQGSLVAVGLMSALGTLLAWRAKLVVWRAGLIFAAAGFISAPLGVHAGTIAPPWMLTSGFSLLALVIAATMWRRIRIHPEESGAVRMNLSATPIDVQAVCALAGGELRMTTPCAVVLLVSGAVTGLLSGFFGVGGGFLIVPALIASTRLPIQNAVATSLLVITLIAVSGSGSAILSGHRPDSLILLFAGGGLIGMIAGRLVAPKLSGVVLQQTFALMLALTGAGMLAAQLWRFSS
ncbi:MAG: sulfite exporter TauE/SafE family protein [Stenotrophobium sp.]